MKKLSVGVIGCGYWGPNLIRNFTACPLTEVVAVCDVFVPTSVKMTLAPRTTALEGSVTIPRTAP